ncbi:MAG: thioesterase domain-containing protein [Rhizonema sp. PD37]|nr:thioesterase domain-containing protein [Rhizonema sp. PD37]
MNLNELIVELSKQDVKLSSQDLGKTFVAPRNTLELQIAQIWEDILHVYHLGVKDNFFDLGGDSLLATRLVTEIQKQFEKDIPLLTLFQNATIEQLASILGHSVSLTWEPLVALQHRGSKPPFFLVPGGDGIIFNFYHLAHHLGYERPFYTFQARGIYGDQPPYNQVEEMATDYIKALRTVQPQGPYLLGGHCFGAFVAFEMAIQLKKQGQEVALLAILDASEPSLSAQTVVRFVGDSSNSFEVNTTFLTLLVYGYELWLNKKLSICYEDLKLLKPDEQLNYVMEQLKKVHIFPSNATVKQLRNIIQVFSTSAFINYVPQEIYSNEITVFRASENHLSNDITMGWSKLSSKSIKSYEVPGNHITMMTEPHIQFLVQQLKVCIAQAH